MIHRKIPRTERFGIGARIDSALLDLLIVLQRATFSPAEKKIPLLEIGLIKIDDLRFFYQIIWETHLISDKQFIDGDKELGEIGRMVGGWRKGLMSKTPAKKAGER